MPLNYFSQYTPLDEDSFDGSLCLFIGYDLSDLTSSSSWRMTGDDFVLWLKKQLVYSTPIVALTGSFGTTGDAIADVTASFDQSILNNNFRALEDKYNALHAALLSAGIIKIA